MARQETEPLKSSSPPSIPTTPSPALAASSFSQSVTSASRSSSPRARSRSTSPSAPTSPAVAYAFDCFRKRYLGTLGQTEGPAEESDEQWLEIQLNNSEWLSLQAHIASLDDLGLWDYIDNLRYDYFADYDLLILRLRSARMPGRTHEFFIRMIDKQVEKQLAQLGLSLREHNSEAARFTDDVKPWGSLRMQFGRVASKSPSDELNDEEGIQSQHEPDCSYSATKYDPAYPNLYPAAIIEVVTSKKRGRLAMLADDYLLGTDIGPIIQVMLAVDVDVEHLEGSGLKPRGFAKVLEYRRHEAPLAVGEVGPVFTVQETEHIFRNHNGERLPGEIRLSLSDFAPFGDDPRLEADPDQSISLDFDWLNDMLSEAEQQAVKAAEALKAAKAAKVGTKRKADEVDDEGEGGPPQAKRHAWPARGKRRGHHSAPVERLTTEDEERMRRAEDDADRRVRRYDRSGARGYVSRTRPNCSVEADGGFASEGEGDNVSRGGGDGEGEPSQKKGPRRSTRVSASAGKA